MQRLAEIEAYAAAARGAPSSSIARDMKYNFTHKTWYAYTEPAPVCHNLVHLAPRATPRQSCANYRLRIDPTPAFLSRRDDYFGNTVEYFSIEGPHRRLEVDRREHRRSAAPGRGAPGALAALGKHRRRCARTRAIRWRRWRRIEPLPWQFIYASPRIALTPELRDYAAASFPPGRPIVECLRRPGVAHLPATFKFDPRATTVHTPVADVLRLRSGVCQDFAHLAVGALRAMGLPGRYVSGYLRTTPPPGKPRLIGADASHAWASCWCGDLGWVDFRPHQQLPGRASITSPSPGVATTATCARFKACSSAAASHTMGVSVDVLPQEAA